jgi:hypothetical protein
MPASSASVRVATSAHTARAEGGGGGGRGSTEEPCVHVYT